MEKTIEEKAKAYDEVVERITNAVKNGFVSDNFGREMLGIEESEDESIRKEIMDFIYWAIGRGSITNEQRERSDSWLAYLEKQKAKERYDRMAPIYENRESFESALDKAWKFYNDSGSSTVDGCEDNAFELAFSKGFREGFLCREKQKGQKPIELSDNFEIALEEFLMNADSSSQTYAEDVKKYANKLRGIVCKEQEATKPCDGNCDECTCFQAGLEIGRSEQKIVEVKYLKFKEGDKINRYDREDEEDCILTIISVNIDEHCYVCNQCSVIDFEEQDLWHIVEQESAEAIPDSVKFDEGFKTGRELGFRDGVESVKPAKWSEEDERILTGIIERGSSQVPFGEPALREEQMDWLMNRLKSLRPSWKPSEKQMEALLNSAQLGSLEIRVSLSSLYNDLKKL